VPLPANVPHEVEALEDSVLLDVFSPVREDWLRGEDAYLRR
jgi:quercetin dioxygenase-like cupin family protein